MPAGQDKGSPALQYAERWAKNQRAQKREAAEAILAMRDSLRVFLKDESLCSLLSEHDPMAWQQANKANAMYAVAIVHGSLRNPEEVLKELDKEEKSQC